MRSAAAIAPYNYVSYYSNQYRLSYKYNLEVTGDCLGFLLPDMGYAYGDMAACIDYC